MNDWGGLLAGIGGALTAAVAAATAFFTVKARREAKAVARVAAAKQEKVDTFDAAMASMKQSLEWSDADRAELRTQLDEVRQALVKVERTAATDQIKCDRKIAELMRRIEDLEAHQ